MFSLGESTDFELDLVYPSVLLAAKNPITLSKSTRRVLPVGKLQYWGWTWSTKVLGLNLKTKNSSKFAGEILKSL